MKTTEKHSADHPPAFDADSFLFMKVGNHAGESFDQIVARKQREFDDAGMIFWGYGGSACHPLTQVQPFVSAIIGAGGIPTLVMQYISSTMDQGQHEATEYSKDGINWEPVPEGIHVTGSRHAIVIDEITEGDFLLDTTRFKVGVGPSQGKSANEYLRGRTDKACLVVDPAKSAEFAADAKDLKVITHQAKLKDPFAVLLR